MSRVQRLNTAVPQAVTLAAMGRAARQAADTWTMRRWAGRLAARAGHRDFVGQLRELYRGILERWRYVQETDEWTHGTGRSLLAHVLGTEGTCTDPTHCDVEAGKHIQRGFGDCDDVSALVAAGALALGMRPFWRVARGPKGAHVSVLVRTPDAKLVSVDPVAHPHHKFGWAATGPGVSITVYTLAGQPSPTLSARRTVGVAGLGASHCSCRACRRPGALGGGSGGGPPRVVAPIHRRVGQSARSTSMNRRGLTRRRRGPMFYPAHAREADEKRRKARPTTWWTDLEGRIRRMGHQHLCAVHPADRGGARVLAMPQSTARAFGAGLVIHGAPAVDQHGQEWTYDASRDVWVMPQVEPMAGLSAFGGLKGHDWLRVNLMVPREFKLRGGGSITLKPFYIFKWLLKGFLPDHVKQAKKKRWLVLRSGKRTHNFLLSDKSFGWRWRRAGRAVKRGFRRMGRALKKFGKWAMKALRNVVGGLLSSNLARRLIGGILRIIGVPAKFSRAAMAAAGYILKKTGVVGLFRLVRKDPKKALRVIAEAVAEAGKQVLMGGVTLPGFNDAHGLNGGTPKYVVHEQGQPAFVAAPVAAVVGAPGAFTLGELQVHGAPTPGGYYLVQKGDNLLSIARRAYDKADGPSTVTGAQWISNLPANAYARGPTTKEFDKKYFGDEIVKLFPRHACDGAEAVRGVGGSCYPVLWIPMAEGLGPPDAPIDDPDIPDPEPIPDPVPGPVPDPVPPLPDDPVIPDPYPEPLPDPDYPPAPPQCAEGYQWDEARQECAQICAPGTDWDPATQDCKVVPGPGPDLPDFPNGQPAPGGRSLLPIAAALAFAVFSS